MNKLLFLFMLPALGFSQEDIERYKIYPTENIYTSLKLDTATGRIWQLQIGLGDDVDRVASVLSDEWLVDNKDEWIEIFKSRRETWLKDNPNATQEEIENNAPPTVEDALKGTNLMLPQNGRFKLYPTDNMYNFILQDVIDGYSYQVQRNNDEDKRFIDMFFEPSL